VFSPDFVLDFSSAGSNGGNRVLCTTDGTAPSAVSAVCNSVTLPAGVTQIRAITMSSAGVSGPEFDGIYIVFAAPAALKPEPIINASDCSLIVTWAVPSPYYDGGSNITNATILVHDAAGTGPNTAPTLTTVVTDPLLSTSWRIAPVIGLANYAITVSICNVFVCTGSQQTYVNMPAAVFPDVVRNLAIVSASGGSLTIAFGPPSNDGGQPIRSYLVTWVTGTRLSGQSSNVPLIGPRFTLYGLTMGANVSFAVTAVNGVVVCGLVAPVATVFGATSNTTTAPVGQQQPQLTAAASSISITFPAVLDSGGSPVLSYLLQAALAPADHSLPQDANYTRINSTTPTHRSFVYSGLSALTTYFVRVAAVNVKGLGEFSLPASITTLDPTAPGAPVVQLSSVNATGGSITFQWMPNVDTGGRAAIGAQVVRVASGSPDVTFPAFQCDVGQARCTIFSLAVQTHYVVKLRVSNGIYSAYSSAVTLSTLDTATAPGSPKPPTVAVVPNCGAGLSQPPCQPGGTTLMVVWSAPLDTGGIDIKNYTLYVNGSAVSNATSSLTYQVSGLIPGSTQRVSVRAANLNFVGPVSEVLVATTSPTGKPGKPGVPVQDAALSSGGSACFRWTAPVEKGSGRIVGYKVFRMLNVSAPSLACETEPNAHCQSVLDRPSNSTPSCCISGLTVSTLPYGFQVAAYCDAGRLGQLSSTGTVLLTKVTAPGRILSLVAGTVGARTVTVSWSAPASNGGVAITLYNIVVTNTSTNVSAAVTSYSMSSLLPSSVYTFIVRAFNGVAFSAPETLEVHTASLASGSAQFMSGSSTFVETSGNVSIPLVRTGGFGGLLTVFVNSVAGGLAVSSVNFVALHAVPVTFADGANKSYVTVRLLHDYHYLPTPQSVFLTVSSGSNVTGTRALLRPRARAGCVHNRAFEQERPLSILLMPEILG
jgi:hypothetical protein